MQVSLDLVIIIQIITAIVVVAGFVWRLPSKADIRRLDDRIDELDTKIDDRHDKLDAKIDDRYNKLDAKIGENYAKLDTKIDDIYVKLDTKIDENYHKLDAKIDENYAKLDTKFDDNYVKLDNKIDDTRKEMKADMHRIEDRLVSANQYHARSVELLDAIRRELEERRQPQ